MVIIQKDVVQIKKSVIFLINNFSLAKLHLETRNIIFFII